MILKETVDIFFSLYWGWVDTLCPQRGKIHAKNVADASFCENSLSR